MKWIKCSNRLPIDEQECLVAYKCAPNVVYNLAIFHSNKFTSWEVFRDIENVTHWMPLPEAPKD